MELPPSFVSVIIPVYNGEAFLAEAVESIRQQEHDPLEIIIVDDGSTDNTQRIADGLKGDVRYVHQPNRGLPAARNRGLDEAEGDVIAFLDVDDLWSEKKLDRQLWYLNAAPSADIVIGYTQIMIFTDIVGGRHIFREWGNPVLAMSVGSALFRRSVFDSVGRFDETQRYCDDWDWFMRAREHGVSMVVHRDVTQFYRRHGGNMTNQEQLGNHYFINMLKKSLDRRREKTRSPAESLPRLSCIGEEPSGILSDLAEGKAED
ncbi:MAG TPA: glycosyltransferase [Thermodesulfovibrionales bacterium]|nr:glycosyltransferase [Thermodesulfovibrionales bacterium]